MTPAFAVIWPQPLFPLYSPAVSAAAAAVPLMVMLVLMGGFRRSGLVASACGLGTAGLLALTVWQMPLGLASWSVLFGFIYAVWPNIGILFAGLWLYNLACATGSFDLLRRWMAEQASGNPCVQALLVAFCFGALLESCAGFGAPVAVTAFLMVGLGFEARRAVVISLLANTAPVGFGGMGIPIVTLSDVTGLDRMHLSSMVGRQLPLLSVVIPFLLVWVVGGKAGVKSVWPAALVTGVSYAATQFLVSNLWGPYAADIIAASTSIAALVLLLRSWSPKRAGNGRRGANRPAPVGTPADSPALSKRETFAAWLPWLLLALVMVFWSFFGLLQHAIPIRILGIPNDVTAVQLPAYQKSGLAIYKLRPLDVGTAVLLATALTGLCFRVSRKIYRQSAAQTLRLLLRPGLTVLLMVGLANLYNYSGMAYTLGEAVARLGPVFPLVSSYLGWAACFLTGSDAVANLLFGNLQVAAAHQLHLSPVLLAATNSSGGVISKMISPQNIAVGVATVGLVGQEGSILRRTFWPSIVLAAVLGLLAYAQAYCLPWMVP